MPDEIELLPNQVWAAGKKNGQGHTVVRRVQSVEGGRVIYLVTRRGAQWPGSDQKESSVAAFRAWVRSNGAEEEPTYRW